jgi:hypothetical protein
MAATAAAAAAATTAAGCLCAWGWVNAPAAAERELTRPGPEIGTETGAAALDAELTGWLAARMAEYDDDAAFRAKMEAKWGGRGEYEGYLREAIAAQKARAMAAIDGAAAAATEPPPPPAAIDGAAAAAAAAYSLNKCGCCGTQRPGPGSKVKSTGLTQNSQVDPAV